MMRETEIINYNPSEGCRVEWCQGPEDMSVDVMGLQVRRIVDSNHGFQQHEISISKWGSDHHSGPLVVEGDAVFSALANIGPYKLSVTINEELGVWAQLIDINTNMKWPVRFVKDEKVKEWKSYEVYISEQAL